MGTEEVSGQCREGLGSVGFRQVEALPILLCWVQGTLEGVPATTACSAAAC